MHQSATATRAMGMGMDLQNYSIQNDDECEKVSVFSIFSHFSLFVFSIQSEKVNVAALQFCNCFHIHSIQKMSVKQISNFQESQQKQHVVLNLIPLYKSPENYKCTVHLYKRIWIPINSYGSENKFKKGTMFQQGFCHACFFMLLAPHGILTIF